MVSATAGAEAGHEEAVVHQGVVVEDVEHRGVAAVEEQEAVQRQ